MSDLNQSIDQIKANQAKWEGALRQLSKLALRFPRATDAGVSLDVSIFRIGYAFQLDVATLADSQHRLFAAVAF